MKFISRFTPIMLAAPLTLIAATATAEPVGAVVTPEITSQTEVPDLSGTWAQKVVTSAVSKVSMIGEVISQTVAINQVQIKQNGREITVTTKPCSVELLSDQSMIKPQIPRSYIDAMDTHTRKATLQGDAGKYSLVMPGRTTVLGANLKSLDDALPTEPNDPRVVDPDKDGQPGMTMSITGLVKSDLYLVQKHWDKMKGQLLPGDRIAGEVTWKTNQVILGATSRMVGDSPASSPHPDKKQSYFRMTRVDEADQCQNIVSKKKELF
ncbi:hypothetical protein [Bradymonas sediminis]|uniref:Uncharacterized protein n=1 Tax=Bradymonas sediminis TaxID=1548548 RepID=A0A2Z4FL47_9DELT|nr:hypothetical protein [Bradymonas sediminis]AWV89727.1 hypothetical protein DN745_10395 [Bradymonas sediminis]TDP76530.1 hypothetical protein DFR33_102161 [Bradymonas sediminis]